MALPWEIPPHRDLSEARARLSHTVRTVARDIQTLTGSAGLGLLLVDYAGGQFVYGGQHGLDDRYRAALPVPFSERSAGQCLGSRRPVVVDSLHGSRYASESQLADAGRDCLVCIPVLLSSRPVAVFEFLLAAQAECSSRVAAFSQAVRAVVPSVRTAAAVVDFAARS